MKSRKAAVKIQNRNITKRGKAVPFIDCNEAAKWAAAETAGGRNNWRTSEEGKKAAGRGQSTGQWSNQRETEERIDRVETRGARKEEKIERRKTEPSS